MEFIVLLANGWTIRIPFLEDRTTREGKECFHVRVCDANGEERGYWDLSEFQEDPALCIGAFLGMAQNEAVV